MSRVSSRRLLPLIALVAAVALAGCSGSAGTGGGPTVTDNQPLDGGGLRLGTTTSAGITVTGAGLQPRGAGIAVTGSLATDHPDRLVSIDSNYTDPVTLAEPLAVAPGPPTPIDPATAVLRPSGPIADGATVAVSLTFATAGVVQVYAVYDA